MTTKIEPTLTYDKIVYCKHDDILDAKIEFTKGIDHKDVVELKTISDSYFGVHTYLKYKDAKKIKSIAFVDMDYMYENGKGKRAWVNPNRAEEISKDVPKTKTATKNKKK